VLWRIAIVSLLKVPNNTIIGPFRACLGLAACSILRRKPISRGALNKRKLRDLD
jgi:hypothetical protein